MQVATKIGSKYTMCVDAYLKVLGVDGGSGVTDHLLEDSQVHSITNAQGASLSIALQLVNEGLAGGEVGGGDRLGGDGRPLGRGGLGVVVRVRGIGVLQLLGELAGRRGGVVGEGHGGLDHRRGAVFACLQLGLADLDPLGALGGRLLEDGQRVGLGMGGEGVRGGSEGR